MIRSARIGLRAAGLLVLALLLVMISSPGWVISAQSQTGGSSISARQSGYTWQIQPLRGTDSPQDLYNYQNFQSLSSLIEPDSSLVFFYQQENAGVLGDLNLVVINGPSPDSINKRQVSISLSGLPNSTILAVKDDPDDYYWLSPPSASIRWAWESRYTDGVVFGALQGDFSLALKPDFDAETKHWVLITGDLIHPEEIELRDFSMPLTFEVRAPDPFAAFTHSPDVALVGQPVLFDAGNSRSSNGAILQYLWDFNSDGSYETRSSTTTVSHIFQNVGLIKIGLEIVDSRGDLAQSWLNLEVQGEPISAIRKIRTPLPDEQTMPETDFTVELELHASTSVIGLGVRENPPSGWQIESLDGDGAQFNPATHEWVFLQSVDANTEKRILYRVKVPAYVDAGMHSFSGSAVSGLPTANVPVSGGTEVNVIHTLPIEIAISRLTEEWKIDLSRPNSISYAQMQQAVSLWLEQVEVPGTNGRKIDLAMISRLIAYWLTDTPVTEPLPN
ncbi:PKD domain-containing protein [Candidatus Acetothermia bacterium]|nr:PKD domain-containing protein [Candidatus Acetothermia bacterium]